VKENIKQGVVIPIALLLFQVSYILMASSPSAAQQVQDHQSLVIKEKGSHDMLPQTSLPTHVGNTVAALPNEQSRTRQRHQDVSRQQRQTKSQSGFFQEKKQTNDRSSSSDNIQEVRKSFERLNSDGSAFKKISQSKYNSHRNAVTSGHDFNLGDINKPSVRTAPKPSTKRLEPKESGTVAVSSNGRPTPTSTKGKVDLWWIRNCFAEPVVE